MQASIAITGEATFNPGEEVPITVQWELRSKETGLPMVDSLQLQLGWRTEGKGDQDSHNVEQIEIPVEQPNDSVQIALVLPDGPYSFSGQLISLIWSLRLYADQQLLDDQELVVGPGRREVRLYPVDDAPAL